MYVVFCRTTLVRKLPRQKGAVENEHLEEVGEGGVVRDAQVGPGLRDRRGDLRDAVEEPAGRRADVADDAAGEVRARGRGLQRIAERARAVLALVPARIDAHTRQKRVTEEDGNRGKSH